MKRISVVTACYNEEENVEEVYNQVKAQFQQLPHHDRLPLEHIPILLKYKNKKKRKQTENLMQINYYYYYY